MNSMDLTLNSIKNSKESIKQALLNKNVELDDSTKFRDYAELIKSISKGSTDPEFNQYELSTYDSSSIEIDDIDYYYNSGHCILLLGTLSSTRICVVTNGSSSLKFIVGQYGYPTFIENNGSLILAVGTGVYKIDYSDMSYDTLFTCDNYISVYTEANDGQIRAICKPVFVEHIWRIGYSRVDSNSPCYELYYDTQSDTLYHPLFEKNMGNMYFDVNGCALYCDSYTLYRYNQNTDVITTEMLPASVNYNMGVKRSILSCDAIPGDSGGNKCIMIYNSNTKTWSSYLETPYSSSYNYMQVISDGTYTVCYSRDTDGYYLCEESGVTKLCDTSGSVCQYGNIGAEMFNGWFYPCNSGGKIWAIDCANRKLLQFNEGNGGICAWVKCGDVAIGYSELNLYYHDNDNIYQMDNEFGISGKVELRRSFVFDDKAIIYYDSRCSLGSFCDNIFLVDLKSYTILDRFTPEGSGNVEFDVEVGNSGRRCICDM